MQYYDTKRPNTRPVNLYKVSVDGSTTLLSAYRACYERIMNCKKVVLLDPSPVSTVYEDKSCSTDHTADEEDFLSQLLRPEPEE